MKMEYFQTIRKTDFAQILENLVTAGPYSRPKRSDLYTVS